MQVFLVEHGSYFLIALVLVLTGCGLPVPEEVPILAAGVMSGGENPVLNPWLAFLSCLVGALIGDCLMYGIGHHWGHSLLKNHPWCAHLLQADREERVEFMIRRHGLKVLLAARFMIGLRSPVYLSAGVLRVGFWRFLLMDLICATAVVGLFFGLAFLYGDTIVRLVRHAEIWLTVVVVVGLAAAGGYYYRRGRKRVARLLELRSLRTERARERAVRHLSQAKTVA